MNIYYYNINQFDNLDAAQLLLPNRRKVFDRQRPYESRAHCLAGGLLMQRFLDITDDTQISFGTNGKPYLKDSSKFFSLSHSGDYVALAVSDCEIGIDIERIKPNREKTAKRFFTEDENQWLGTQDHAQAFFQIWTAKEAVMKATGLGFSLSPRDFSVLPIQNGAHFILEKTFHLYWCSFDNHSLCIASQVPQANLSFISVDYKMLIS